MIRLTATNRILLDGQDTGLVVTQTATGTTVRHSGGIVKMPQARYDTRTARGLVALERDISAVLETGVSAQKCGMM